VSWADVGINAAYTVEISFCGSGNNRERRLIKSYALQQSKNLQSGNEEIVPVNEQLRGILRTYQNEKHYSQETLRNLGSQLCLAMASYSNLRLSTTKPSYKYKREKTHQPDEGENDDTSVDNDNNINNGDEEEAQVEAFELPPLHEVETLEELEQPFLLSSVISDKLIPGIAAEEVSLLCSSSGGGNCYLDNHNGSANGRFEAEVALRKYIHVVGGADSTPQSSSVHVSDKTTVTPSDSTSDNKKSHKSSAKSSKKRRNKKDEETTEVTIVRISTTMQVLTLTHLETRPLPLHCHIVKHL